MKLLEELFGCLVKLDQIENFFIEHLEECCKWKDNEILSKRENPELLLFLQ